MKTLSLPLRLSLCLVSLSPNMSINLLGHCVPSLLSEHPVMGRLRVVVFGSSTDPTTAPNPHHPVSGHVLLQGHVVLCWDVYRKDLPVFCLPMKTLWPVCVLHYRGVKKVGIFDYISH